MDDDAATWDFRPHPKDQLSSADEPYAASDPDALHVWSVGGNGVADGLGMEPVRTEGGHADVQLVAKPVSRNLLSRVAELECRSKVLEQALQEAVSLIDMLKAEQQRVFRLLGDEAATKVDSPHAHNVEEERRYP